MEGWEAAPQGEASISAPEGGFQAQPMAIACPSGEQGQAWATSLHTFRSWFFIRKAMGATEVSCVALSTSPKFSVPLALWYLVDL